MSDRADDFLFGGSGMAFKFEDIGDKVTGVVTDFNVEQQTHMETGEKLTWSNGQPREQLVITLQTDEKSADDDGLRRIFAKGGNYEVAEGTGTSMRTAIADAVKKSGAKSFVVGGKLTVGLSGIGKKTNRGFSAPKLFRASYEAPVKSVSEEDLFGD